MFPLLSVAVIMVSLQSNRTPTENGPSLTLELSDCAGRLATRLCRSVRLCFTALGLACLALHMRAAALTGAFILAQQVRSLLNHLPSLTASILSNVSDYNVMSTFHHCDKVPPKIRRQLFRFRASEV